MGEVMDFGLLIGDWGLKLQTWIAWILVGLMALQMIRVAIRQERSRNLKVQREWEKHENLKRSFLREAQGVYGFRDWKEIWGDREEERWGIEREIYILSEGAMAPAKDFLPELINRNIKRLPGVRFGATVICDHTVGIAAPAQKMPHHYIIGGNGTGKSTLMQNCILQRIHGGDGVSVLAQEREQIVFLAERIPPERRGEVVFVDATGEFGAPPSLNLLSGRGKDTATDNTLQVLSQLWSDLPQAHQATVLLMNAAAALEEVEGATLKDAERMIDPGERDFRGQILPRIQNPEVRDFWENKFPRMPVNAGVPLLHRLGPFLSNRYIRNVVCHPDPMIDFRDLMDRRQIVIANLNDGVLGGGNARILGQLIVARIQQATMSRADASGELPWAYVYLDEFQKFLISTLSYEEFLARARKYRVDFTLAHQYLDQIPRDLLKGIWGNVGILTAFNVGPTDARALSEMLLLGNGKRVSPEALMTLKRGEAWMRLKESERSFRLWTELWKGERSGEAWWRDTPPASFDKGEGRPPGVSTSSTGGFFEGEVFKVEVEEMGI